MLDKVKELFYIFNDYIVTKGDTIIEIGDYVEIAEDSPQKIKDAHAEYLRMTRNIKNKYSTW